MADLKSEIVIELGCPTVDGIPCTCELCQRLFWRHANSILTLIRAKVDEIDFTEYHSKVTGLEWVDGFNQALKAVKEVLK